MSYFFGLLNLVVLFCSSFLFDGSPREFNATPKSGRAPLTVTFSAEHIKNAKKANTFIWNFGNGETLTTTHPTVNYTYSNAGIFSASLRYEEREVDKKKPGKG